MVLPHAIRQESTKIEQLLKIPNQKRIEVQNVLSSSVKVFQLTTEVKELSRKIRVAMSDYDSSSTSDNAVILSNLLLQKKTAKEELSLAKREFMQAADNYQALGGVTDVTAKDGSTEAKTGV